MTEGSVMEHVTTDEIVNVFDTLGHSQLFLSIRSVKGVKEGGFRFKVNVGPEEAVAG